MTPTRTLAITVSEGLYGRFVEMSRKQGMTPPTYAKLLFEAAYSARCGMTGDKALDAAVAAIGVERAAAPAGGSEETEHLRQRLSAALDAAEKWKSEAQEREKDWCDAVAERDITRVEVENLRVSVAEQARDAARARDEARDARAEIAKLQERQAYDVGLIETQGKTISELKAKVADQERVIGGLNLQLTEQFDLSTKMTTRAVEAEQSIKSLEARIAAATMTEVPHPEPATLAEAGGGMEETATAQRAEKPQAVSSAILALTPDQAKRARTYHGYGMSAAEIAAAMQVDAAIVEAALRRAA